MPKSLQRKDLVFYCVFGLVLLLGWALAIPAIFGITVGLKGKFNQATFFVTDAVPAATRPWDMARLYPNLDTEFHLGWTMNMQRDMEDIRTKRSTLSTGIKIFQHGQATLGNLQDMSETVCMDLETEPFCLGEARFAKGQARIGLYLKKIQGPDKKTSYKITTLIIEYPINNGRR
ncbi:MAG: hypothetical protein JWM96_39 [Alphaproteobacteria bacterium]|nr:hypothetical protein [Alphaproteobacteria bacterium]